MALTIKDGVNLEMGKFMFGLIFMIYLISFLINPLYVFVVLIFHILYIKGVKDNERKKTNI